MIHPWKVDAGLRHAVPLQAGDTLPEVFRGAVAARADAVFLRSKHLGVWASTSWREAGAAVDEVCAGLALLGVQCGQTVCVLSHTRAECIVADLAVLTLGAVSAAVPCGVVPDMAGLCRQAGAALVIVEDDEQLAALRDRSGRLPTGLRIVVIRTDAEGDADGASGRTTTDAGITDAGITHSAITAWGQLRAMGRQACTNDAGLLARLRTAGGAGGPSATAILSCSAGTTAAPVWVGHSHEAVLATCRAIQGVAPQSSADRRLSFLSWARPNERLLGLYLPLLAGTVVNFCEGLDTVPENLREVAPTTLSAMPRQLEKLRAEVAAALDDAGRLPRAVFDRALKYGDVAAQKLLRGEPVGWALRARCTLGRWLVIGNVRRFMGLDRCRQLIAVDTPMPAALANWYLAMGIPLVQTWGTTQSLGVATINALPGLRIGSVGMALPHRRIQVDAGSGELSILGGGGDGARAVRTGDIGRVDADGYVWITGRFTERLRSAAGDEVPASHIQAALRESPFVQDALVFAEGRPYASALILLARDKVEHHAHRIGLSFTDFAGLSRSDEVRALLQAQVDRVNQQMPPGQRVHRFDVIDADLAPGDEEITPTLLLRRWSVGARRAPQIDNMYL